MFGAVTSALPYVRSGQVRALAVLTDERSPLLPGVPTVAQAGLGSVDVRKWMGLLVPAGTPPAIVAKLNVTLNAILDDPSMHAWMQRQGFEIPGGPPLGFGSVLNADFLKWGDTVRQIGLRPE
jgi:tripartite-type tricarboxylate transporter receptor subunit TctC